MNHEEEDENDVKVIYREGDIIRTVKAKFLKEDEAELVVMRKMRKIRFPWRVVERVEHFTDNVHDDEGW